VTKLAFDPIKDVTPISLVGVAPLVLVVTLPGFESTSWYTIMGPARMPAALVARLNTEVNALVKTPEIANRLAADTVEPRALSPEATARHVADEIARWKAVAQRAGVRLD
jgi:tripartite-type tricarboxylate transporter receptor subunit TctC